MDVIMLVRVILTSFLVTTVRCHGNVSAVQELKISVECNKNNTTHVDIRVPPCVCPAQPPLPPTKIATPTASGYELAPGLGHYKFHAYGATWHQGQQRCAEEGAHLLVINSQREANVVVALFVRYPTMPGAEQTGWAWTGVHEKRQNGNYVTLLGGSLYETGFATWSVSEPNDPEPDDCVLTNRITAHLGDAACHRLFAFICELEL